MSVSIPGVKIINGGRGSGRPMSLSSVPDDERCEVCGANEWSPIDEKGEIACLPCGNVRVQEMFDSSEPNWKNPEPGDKAGGRSGGGKWGGKISDNISHPWFNKERPAGDSLGGVDSQKVREIKLEIERIVDDPDTQRLCKEKVEILQRKQIDYLNRGNERECLLINVGLRPAIVNTFCVACAIVIRFERDKAGTGRDYGATEILERVKERYCEEGAYVFRGGGETYRLEPSRAHPGLGKTLSAMITEYCVNLDKIWFPSHREAKRRLMSASEGGG